MGGRSNILSKGTDIPFSPMENTSRQRLGTMSTIYFQKVKQGLLCVLGGVWGEPQIGHMLQES